jgi:hypothetical protein
MSKSNFINFLATEDERSKKFYMKLARFSPEANSFLAYIIYFSSESVSRLVNQLTYSRIKRPEIGEVGSKILYMRFAQHLLVAALAYASTFKMEATCTSKHRAVFELVDITSQRSVEGCLYIYIYIYMLCTEQSWWQWTPFTHSTVTGCGQI